MIYKENFKIGLKDVEISNKLGNKAILEYLENIAAYHSDLVGYGVNTIEKTGVSWILLDWKVEVIKRPEYGQTLRVHTWSRKIIKYYAYRDFEIYDEQGNLCVIATSKWVLINFQTGKIERVKEEMASKYESEIGKKVFKEEEELEKLTVLENSQNEILYETRRKDIDRMGHMHNLYYLDLAYEAMPKEVYERRPFDKVRIMYKREIKLGNTVSCQYGYEKNKHKVMIQSKETKVLHAIVELE